MALLQGLKEVEEAQKRAAGEHPAPEPEAKPEPPSTEAPPRAPEPKREPEPSGEPEPRKHANPIAAPLPKGAELLDREPDKKVSVGDVNRKRKDYGRDAFRDDD